MTHRYSKGFTIIETMLVLSITAVMVVALLVGVSVNINSQRYRDSVNGLKSLIQEQFSNTLNVQNEVKPVEISCDSNATIQTTGLTKPRGQSDCVLMGRYMEIVQDKVTVSSVVGSYDSTASSNVADVALLKSTKLSILDSSTEVSTLDWGTAIAWPSSGSEAKTPTQPRSLYILILRSPTSGSTYAFTSDTVLPFSNMIVSTETIPGRAERTVCIDSGGLVSGNGLSVFIDANTSGQSDIQFKSNDAGGVTQC